MTSVPKMRFSDFSDEWVKRNIKSVTSKIGSGKTPKGGSETYKENGICLIRSQNVKNEGLDLTDVAFIDDTTDESMKNTRVKYGDVLLNITGASIGRCCVFKNHVQANVNQHVCILRPKEKFSSAFIQTKMISPDGQNAININQAGSGREGLNFEQIGNMQFYFPSFEEQCKIAVFFTTLDQIINQTQAEVNAWEKQKQGMMQKLFSQEIRFKADDRSEYPDWIGIKIQDMFDEISDKNHSEENVLSIIQGSGTVKREDSNRNVIYNKESLNSYKLVKKNDFIVHLRSFEGGLEIATLRGIVSPAYIILRGKISIIPDFYRFYFRSFKFIHKDLTRITEGIRDGKSLNMKDFWNLKIPYPYIYEQQKIADCLSSFDAVIGKAKQELEAYKQLKKGLMQQMFV